MSKKIQKEGQNTEQNVIMTLQKHDVLSGCGWDRTTLSSCWLSEAIKIHSMSSGPLSSGARVNRQSSFTLWPLAFSTNVCPVDVMSRPEAKPSRHGHRREGLRHTGVNWTDDRHIRGKKEEDRVSWMENYKTPPIPQNVFWSNTALLQITDQFLRQRQI